MRTLALTLPLAACYTPPDVPRGSYQWEVLSSGEDSPFSVCAAEKDARVSCTIDGDTFDFGGCGGNAGGERVRMLGINAPETAKPGQAAECYADLAFSALTRLIDARTITLSYDRNCVDPFGRTLAYVWMNLDDIEPLLRPGTLDELESSPTFNAEAEQPRVLVNEVMLLEGWAYRFDEEWVEPLRWEAEMVAAERLAQVRKLGVWGACEGG
jgi:endonuclease YncB( thermonuclease family)